MSRAAFVNARVTTMDPTQPRAGGIFVEDGKIAALFDGEPTGLGKDARLVDLRGAAVYPGFHDCHAHLADTGLLAGDHDFGDCPDVEAMLRRVRALPDPLLYAGNFEEHRLAERRAPTLSELDAVSPDRPVLLTRIDGHSCVVNSAALKLLGAEREQGVERDADDKPTGRLFAAANYAAQDEFFRRLDDQTYRQAESRAAQIALAAGITTIHNVLVGEDSLEQLQSVARANAALPLHVIAKSCTTDVAKARKLGTRLFGGDIFVDGSIGSRTAALSQPYRDRPDESGRLYLDRDRLFELFDEASQAGLTLGVHAIGDRGIEEVISAWERLVARRGRHAVSRSSIDHYEVTTREQVERTGRLGLLLSMQPAFDHLWGGEGGMYEERLGPERSREMNQLKSALRAGNKICGGSDSPVTKLDALLGIHAAVNHHVAEQRLTVHEALAAYTTDAAMLAFEEQERGTLKPGMAADFVALEESLEEVAPSRIKDVKVLATIVSGQLMVSNL